jgi:DNA-binding NarL/FixJ family response regulator
MDMVMPGMGGVEATRIIKERYAQVQVIALTSVQEGDMVERALRAGARSYLLKNVSALDLAQAIRAAHKGRSVLAPEATEALVQAMARPQAPGGDLSEREREVLRLLVQGLSNAQIGRQLSISLSTVKYHLRSIFAKFEVATRAEAVAAAYQRGQVET